MERYDPELANIVETLNRAATGPRDRTPTSPGPQDTSSLDELLGWAVRQGASDILLIAGAPVCIRVSGVLTPSREPALTQEEIRRFVLPLLTAEQHDELQKSRSLDLAFVRDATGRFRANFHFQRGGLAAAIRLLPARIPSLESLHLPASLTRIADMRQGLVLVTGPSGCGKSSTLAALLDLINARRRDHIVTIEDPVEYQHSNRSSIVEQMEVGRDTPDVVRALRSVLRQDPDVILVGEMRDPETMATVLTAAETGHLVFSTLHTNDAAQAVSRILDAFPAAHQPQIRQQLSLAIAAVIAQQLLPAAHGTARYPAVEIMFATDAIRHLIRRGEDHQLRSQLTMGRPHGMITMEQSLADLVRHGRISRDTALAHCFRLDDLRRLLE